MQTGFFDYGIKECLVKLTPRAILVVTPELSIEYKPTTQDHWKGKVVGKSLKLAGDSASACCNRNCFRDLTY